MKSALLAALAVVTVPVVANAQTPANQSVPNLLGSWKGTTNSIVINQSGSRTSASSGHQWENPSYDDSALVLTVTMQKGSRFVGNVAINGKPGGKFIGAIGNDGRELIFVGPFGSAFASLKGTSQLEYCYADSDAEDGNTDYVAGCSLLTR